MDILSTILDTLLAEIWNAIGRLIGTTLTWAFFGLVASLFALRFARKRKLLKRQNPLWNGLTVLYYLYLPLLFIAMGGALGFVRGLQKNADYAIEKTSELFEFVDLDELTTFIQIADRPDMIPFMDVDFHKVVPHFVETEFGLPKGDLSNRFASAFMLQVFEQVFDELGVPMSLRGSLSDMRPHMLQEGLATGRSVQLSIPIALQGASDSFFFQLFLIVLGGFFPFLLGPLAEYLLHLVLERPSAVASPRGMDQNYLMN